MVYDRVRQDESEPRKEGTKISCEQISREKVTVSRRDTTQSEQIEKPRHLKELDIGRIVIEEISEEKEELQKHDISRKEKVKPVTTDLTGSRYEVEEVSSAQVKKDTITVGKRDLTDIEKTLKESRHAEERVTSYRDLVDGTRKVV